MKAGWETKPLGEIIQLEYGKPLDASQRKPDGVYPVYGANGEKDRSDTFFYDKPSIIVGRKGSAGEVNLTEARFWPLDVTYFVTFDETRFDLQFLYHLLSHLELPKLAKGVKPGINRNEVYAIDVAAPQLPEQQRIVAILDEAFAGIATACAVAEQNRQNARALFESHLQTVFSQRGKGWIKTTVGDQLTLQRGFDITKEQQQDGKIPVVSSGGIKSFHDTPMAKAPGVVIGRKGTLGKTFYLESDYWPHDTTLWVKDFKGNEPRFIYYLLSGLSLKELDTGTANPALNRNLVHPIQICWPSVCRQKELVQQLDALSDETQRLEALYQHKLEALGELKKSLLHQAFNGQLTKSFRSGVVISFPSRVANIEVADLHAGLLAMAYLHHEKDGKQKYFGHVKAEKTAHMLEALVGIDLERNAIKDAAGPNDFQRLKDVEKHARRSGYFSFDQVDGKRYRVTKLKKFDALVEKTRAALGDRLAEVEALLETMLPMKTRSAEIFCTVYAAWNNMLLENKPISDEKIVWEARENWHPDKLKIRRERFFIAIEWIRNKRLSPQGRGKLVRNKAT